jgi:hypothetical protein
MTKKAKRRAAKHGEAKAGRPNYLTAKAPKPIKMHSIMDVMDMLEKHGQYNKFKKLMKTRTLASVDAAPKTINLVKKFVRDNGLQNDPLGAKILMSDDYECPI